LLGPVPPPSFLTTCSPTLYPTIKLLIPSLQDGGAPSDSLGISHLIRAYQVSGHFAAKLDPLGIHHRNTFPKRPAAEKDGYPEELGVAFHGFTEADLDRPLNFKGTSTGGNKGYLEELASSAINMKITLRGIVDQLRKTYCGSLGVEYMHIGNPQKVNWIRERVETPRWLFYDKEKKQHIYERLCFADTFETFLAYKFNTTKRFGLDGGEAIVPALKDAIDRASELGAHSFVIGMPHRGRLNILANVMRKPMPLIFSEFMGTHYDVEDHVKSNLDWGMSGDVKYHLGSSMDRTYPDGRKIHLSLVANPSHLECVNPVVVGKARAKQYYGGNRYVILLLCLHCGLYFMRCLVIYAMHLYSVSNEQTTHQYFPSNMHSTNSLLLNAQLKQPTTAPKTIVTLSLSSFTVTLPLLVRVSSTKPCKWPESTILMSVVPFTSL
jgi:2-oxoglutarate dehydrogenase E1 component